MHGHGTPENQPLQEGGHATSMTDADRMLFENEQQPTTQEVAQVEIDPETEDLSMLSANNMGFYQFDSFESDLLLAFASGDAHFGSPEVRSGSTDRMRRMAL